MYFCAAHNEYIAFVACFFTRECNMQHVSMKSDWHVPETFHSLWRHTREGGYPGGPRANGEPEAVQRRKL